MALLTGRELTQARTDIGHRWGLGRALTEGELARALEFQSNGGRLFNMVRDLEREKRPMTGPVSVAVRAFLAGYVPEGAPPELHARLDQDQPRARPWPAPGVYRGGS